MVMEKGVFSVLLGSVTSLSLGFDEPYYLEIKVGNEVMSPRQRIASVGYAFRAEEADNAEKIKASSNDSAAGYLNTKVDDATIEVDVNNKLKLKDQGIAYDHLSSDAKERLLKAWVNFNGIGAVQIRDSYNVTSVVDNGTGRYTINWDRDFANANYCFTFGGTGLRFYGLCQSSPLITAGSIKIQTRNFSEQFVDSKYICVMAGGE